MAKLEGRFFKSKKFLLVLSENEEESKLIDQTLGQPFVTHVTGEIDLSDGYADHYIRLTASAKPDHERTKRTKRAKTAALRARKP